MLHKYFNEIILHCTATPEGKDFSASWVKDLHTKPKSEGGNGWLDIGYHYIIKLDGTIEEGRHLSKIGAHCSASGKNRTSIGISYIGGCADDACKIPKDTRTEAQKNSIEALIRQLVEDYPQIKYLSGHNNYANKACPSFDVWAEYGYLADIIEVV